MTHYYDTQIAYLPPTPLLRYLPEGPYPCGPGLLSWVAIQHGGDATFGSLNILNLETGENRNFELPGRPGFAFPTNREGVFVLGVERRLGLFDTASSQFTPLSEEIDAKVSGTIINDGVCFEEGIVFGAKDLSFAEKKAGLYFFRRNDQRLFQLRSDQICSNGKVITAAGPHRWTLLDIDTPTQQVVRYELDTEAGTLSAAEVVLDLTNQPLFPDGMIATPDGGGVIISMYNPGDAEAGVTQQYRLADGALEAVWRTEAAPPNTCPQLVSLRGAVKLLITTAIENMSPERQAVHYNAGALFMGDTPFEKPSAAPVYELPDGF